MHNDSKTVTVTVEPVDGGYSLTAACGSETKTAVASTSNKAAQKAAALVKALLST